MTATPEHTFAAPSTPDGEIGGKIDVASRLVDVAVRVPAGKGLPVYTYRVPAPLALEIGHLVAVPFGNAVAQGIVVGTNGDLSVAEAREVIELLDPRPVIGATHVALARWIAEAYACTFFDGLQLALPPGVRQRTVTWIERVVEDVDGEDLSPREHLILNLLGPRGRDQLPRLRARLRQQNQVRGVTYAIERLTRFGIVRRYSALANPTVRPRQVTFARVVSTSDDLRRMADERSKAPAQVTALQKLAALPDRHEPRPATELRRTLEISAHVFASLAKQGVFELVEREVRRDPLAHLAGRYLDGVPTASDGTEPTVSRLAPAVSQLTPPQSAVFDRLCEALDDPDRRPFLLHGVTSSGKTNVYLELLATVVARGGQGLVLVPEISLTPQMVQRFASRFPGRVAVLHSRLSAGEHYDEWRRIRAGEVDVVVGSRSALFAPLPALRLIVVDEEHEPSYKQEATPRYHARDAAVKLGELAGALTVLGSATPDVTSFYRATSGRWELLRLDERVAVRAPSDTATGAPAIIQRGVELPPVQLVDMRAELRSGNRSIFSLALRNAITTALALDQQVILFLNRRGSATFVMCRECGHVLRCRRCDVSLAYHAEPEDMVCHLCNFRTSVPPACPNCWSTRIKYFGIGTQKVAEETAAVFPDARVLRWDRDAIHGKHAHEDLLGKFLQREADILVGTQMIAKGLDLPAVTLVGIISADTTLHLPHYRAVERTFQLLTQVAGRAGRGPQPGRVILQTYTPEHYCIQAAQRHDYGRFYTQEIAFRAAQAYPPFSRLVRLLFASTVERRVRQEVERVGRLLRQEIARVGAEQTVVLGPAPAYHARLRGRIRWQLILRAPPETVLRPILDGLALPPGWTVDVDPVSLL